MGFVDAIKSCYGQYVGVTGRAARSEFWWFQLYFVLGYVVLGGLGGALVGEIAGILVLLFALAHFCPLLAVTVRRLHDIDRSGWWYLVTFIPLIGPLVFLYWAVKRGTQGPNSFGNDPLQG